MKRDNISKNKINQKISNHNKSAKVLTKCTYRIIVPNWSENNNEERLSSKNIINQNIKS